MLKNAFFCLLFLLSPSASASGIAHFQGLDNGKPYKLSFEYLNRNTSRINMDDNSGIGNYLLFNNKQAQLVSSFQGNTLVMDLDNMNQVANKLGLMSVLGIDSEGMKVYVISMEAMGKKERVAGIDGKVYRLTWSRNKIKQQDEIVVSKDPRAWEYTEAWVNALEAISKSNPSINIQGNELLAMITNDKVGVLRIGKRFRLAAVQNTAVNPARFSAPDSSFSIQGLGDLLGGM